MKPLLSDLTDDHHDLLAARLAATVSTGWSAIISLRALPPRGILLRRFVGLREL